MLPQITRHHKRTHDDRRMDWDKRRKDIQIYNCQLKKGHSSSNRLTVATSRGAGELQLMRRFTLKDGEAMRVLWREKDQKCRSTTEQKKREYIEKPEVHGSESWQVDRGDKMILG